MCVQTLYLSIERKTFVGELNHWKPWIQFFVCIQLDKLNAINCPIKSVKFITKNSNLGPWINEITNLNSHHANCKQNSNDIPTNSCTERHVYAICIECV